jgi:hypothetical protein
MHQQRSSDLVLYKPHRSPTYVEKKTKQKPAPTCHGMLMMQGTQELDG